MKRQNISKGGTQLSGGLAAFRASWLTTERVIIGGSILATVLIFVIIAVVSGLNQPPTLDPSIPDNSESVPTLGAEHLEPGEQPPPYNSNPPTSGSHTQSVSTAVYNEIVPDVNLIHNLEHGHVWLSYRDANDQAAMDTLAQIQQKFPRRVVVTYRPQNDSRVAAAAWGRLLNVEELNASELFNFILRHSNRAPENVAG